MKYRHLFFDLDNTLWDFEKNSSETLMELYTKYKLNGFGIESPQLFIQKYQERNAQMWEEYRLGKIDKETLRNKRFEFTFWDMGVDITTTISRGMAEDYVKTSPRKDHLFPEVLGILQYLEQKYSLHIITNGFHEAQQIKLDSTGIRKHFKRVFISEHTGFRKPDVNIFYYAQEETKAKTEECLMIGDGLEVDIIGARKAGWDTVYFNPKAIAHTEKVTFEIKNLNELKNFL